MSTRAQKPTIFFERYMYKVEGLSRRYPRLRISVFEARSLEASTFARVNFTWSVLDDGELYDQPHIEIDERLGAAQKAMSLAMRISNRWNRYSLLPSDLQGILALMRARKIVRDDKGHSIEVATDQRKPY